LFIELKVPVNYAMEWIIFLEAIKHRPELMTLLGTSFISKQKEFNSIRRPIDSGRPGDPGTPV